ncbi:hypothetical protein BO94DRAFT_585316 [Aspergillus sclerotioniger CBS 115572]|uniref:Uncharacterized protein n=1 Tax=Aspergillus sclerotioniger CBS 115572 TaxID=1450535 RepID=A0A317WMY6_9EURO|nr:hypothetical protein BO94DRAFT_585316 [Aspergillus sclerotioniger CBS 115572]PWY87834.1 hypothetical protein BO94DRAFT_585316 [Aspergillus sclerotioniger CBS 115572]
MCHVQRVLNTCGHINDHVFLACHIAKAAAALLAPSDINGGCDSFQPQFLKNFPAGTIWERISTTGYHAVTQPYCTDGRVYCLRSPRGFKCMVDGCGRAD